MPKSVTVQGILPGSNIGSGAGPPAWQGPWFSPISPWNTPIPSDWANYVHPDNAAMVQNEYTGTDASPDIHSFAYAATQMQAKWGTIGLTYMKWAGPGNQQNIVFSPNGQPNITLYIDWNPINKVYQFRYTSVQIPLPFNWTGYNDPNAGTNYFERRTAVVCENGDLWALHQVTPPGDPIRNLGTQTDTFWHATTAEKLVSGWTGDIPYWHAGGSGIPPFVGDITPYDFLHTQTGGHFNHVLSFNASFAADGSYTGTNGAHPKFAFPAPFVINGTHPNTDGRTKTSCGIPHGARIFLDPTLTDTDLNTLGVTKEWQLQIARTLQRYGGLSKESVAGQGGAGGIISESIESIAWNISQGFYPGGYQWPWIVDGTTSNADKDSTTYNAAFPAALMPTSGSHWKVWNWNSIYPGISSAA